MKTLQYYFNDLVTKGQILCDSTYMRYLEQSNSYRQVTEWCLPGLGLWAGGLVFNGYKVSVWEDEDIQEMGGNDGCTTV